MTGDVTGGTGPLDGMRVVVLAGEGVEDLEYWVTVMRLREAGAEVVAGGGTSTEVTQWQERAGGAGRGVLVKDIDAATMRLPS